jgi:hypothetical protein
MFPELTKTFGLFSTGVYTRIFSNWSSSPFFESGFRFFVGGDTCACSCVV